MSRSNRGNCRRAGPETDLTLALGLINSPTTEVERALRVPDYQRAARGLDDIFRNDVKVIDPQDAANLNK